MKTQIESFEDIVFENRNKNYGAYELRKKYSKRGSLALFIAICLVSFAVAGPLIANILSKKNFERTFQHGGPVEFANLPVDKPEIKIPEPPADINKDKQVKFVPPKVVNELSEPDQEFVTNDELFEQAKPTDLDTSSRIHVAEKSKDDIDSDSKIEEVINIQEKPMFPGGDSELLKIIAQTARYPQQAIDNQLQGTVYVRFVVTKTGKVGKTIIMRSVDPILDEEALRVVKLLPDWIPGKNNGEPVNVWFIVPVKFELK